jgi:hypothetical protein
MRSCGPPTRSVGPTVRSASLPIGRTHLLGTAVSLVVGDPGVPMSHTAIGGGLTALGLPGESFGFTGFSSVGLFVLISGAF